MYEIWNCFCNQVWTGTEAGSYCCCIAVYLLSLNLVAIIPLCLIVLHRHRCYGGTFWEWKLLNQDIMAGQLLLFAHCSPHYKKAPTDHGLSIFPPLLFSLHFHSLPSYEKARGPTTDISDLRRFTSTIHTKLTRSNLRWYSLSLHALLSYRWSLFPLQGVRITRLSLEGVPFSLIRIKLCVLYGIDRSNCILTFCNRLRFLAIPFHLPSSRPTILLLSQRSRTLVSKPRGVLTLDCEWSASYLALVYDWRVSV